MRKFRGGCHCGNISYGFDWPADGELPLRKCGCSFCVKHGGTYTSHPDAALALALRDPQAVTYYEFGTRSARFCLCRTCGVFVCAISTIDGRDYAVLNVNTLDGFVPGPIDNVQDLEGETLETRLARRQRRWIGKVTIAAAGA